MIASVVLELRGAEDVEVVEAAKALNEVIVAMG